MKRLFKRLAALGGAGALTAALLVAGTALPASATGSDSPTPYTVGLHGVQLPDGQTYQDNGHVNVSANQGDKGIHFESRNNQPSGKWIGQSFLPWEAFGYDTKTLCVTWVQLSQYNEHFGEGGQAPVGKGCSTPEEPPVVPEKPADKSGTETRSLEPVCVEPADGTATVEHQERTWTQTHTLVDNKWVLGEKVYSDWKTVKTETINSEDCEPVVPEQPADKVVTTEWVDGEYDCADTTVTQTRTVSTTPFVLVKNEWVPGETVTTTETQTRDLTEDERKLYQGDNPEGACYVEVPETETETWIEFAVGCETQIGDVIPAVEYTRTVEHDLDPVTGDVTARDNVTTRDFDYTVQPEDLGSVEDCEVPPTEPPVTPEEPPVTPEEPEEPTTPVTPTDDRDCSDFDTQAEAQVAFLAGNTALDGDGDGLACETTVTGQRTGGPTLPQTGSQFPWAALLLGGGLLGTGIYAVTRRKASA